MKPTSTKPRTFERDANASALVGEKTTSTFLDVERTHASIKNSFLFPPLVQRMLRAVRAPDKFEGASRCLQVLATCLTDAEHRWPNAGFQGWAVVAQQAQQSLKNSSANDVLHLLNLPTSIKADWIDKGFPTVE